LVTDSQGNECGTQWEGMKATVLSVLELHTRGFPFECKKHRIFFNAGKIPGCGYKVFCVSSSKERRQLDTKFSDKISRTGTLLKKPNVIENEYFKVSMNRNGTFNILDKILEKEYCEVNYYEDRGEHGDFWINSRPMFDQIHNSLGCSARIWVEESGPLSATIVSELVMELPQRGIKDQQRRGDNLCPLKIQTRVTLRTGQEYIEVAVDLENCHEDHYLRVMIPSNVSKATQVDVGGHFHVDTRPIRPQGPDDSTVWPDMATLPQNNFVDVSDGNTGFGILNDGLMEYEVLDNDERTIALSLIRGVANIYCRELRVNLELASEKGGQSLGKHSYRYAIMPHKGNWQTVNLPLHAELFNVPTRLVQTNRHKGSLNGSQFSFFEVENSNIRFSAFKKTEDRDTFIVRLYNPCKKTQSGGLKFANPIEAAWKTNLNEDRLENLKIKEHTYIPVSVEPFKIETIEVSMA
jgi:mannosylglycerate hydrolase